MPVFSPAPRQAALSAVLAATAVAVALPPFHWPSGAPSALDDAYVRPSSTASQPVLSEARATAPYRARPRPASSPSVRLPRVSDDLEAARVIRVPKPSPPVTHPAAVPSPAASSAPPAQPRPSSPSPYPSYAPLPSQSGAYGSPQAYAESLVGAAQFACLDELWNRESGWNTYASNPSSGAYGIPQALPGDKMAVAGADWQTDADTQVRWGVLDYIDPVYGSPCGAWAHEQAQGWY